MKLGNREGGQQNTLSYSEVEKIYKQVAAIEKRDDWGSRGSWRGRGWHGEELETASQRCFYSVRAGFPGLRGMNSFHTSLLISSQLQSLHSYQANNFITSKSVCTDGSQVTGENPKGGCSNARGRKRERRQANSKISFSQTQYLFVTCHSFKTHKFPRRI